MNLDGVMYALKNVVQRKLRSSLSILSILIGITSIFALVSFGLGIQDYVNTVADEAGRDKLFIQAKGVGAPGSDENFFISQDEVDFVEKIRGVSEVSGLYLKAGEVSYREREKFNFVSGLDPARIDFIEEVFTVDVERGRRLKKGDFDKVVLGYNYLLDQKIFDRGVSLGDKIEINDAVFDVVGFYSELGNPSDDANVYITETAMESLYTDIKGKFGFVMVRADGVMGAQAVAEKIKEKLRKFKGQDEGKEDFFVQTFDDALATFGAIIGVINGVLFLIALISLVVASVNIMNTMYTSVLERTREIGVMKAIGARNSEILFIFVCESSLLGLSGGVLGVLLGYLLASAGGSIAAAGGFALLQPIFPWYLVSGCLFFALLVGAAAGFLPAVHASRQKPVDALRYE
jgi:putative ABC transport system permease protein